jgi:predicted nucleic acid-binding protein
MRSIFVDTDYWVASITPHDNLHVKAITTSAQLAACHLITSDMVLAELLNMFAKGGTHLRKAAVRAIDAITSNPQVEVVPQTRRLFQNALALYRQRPDKDWSITDCASFAIMKGRGIADALTHDHHFEQNGYTALLR